MEYDSQYDGYRFSVPTHIFPRYGTEPRNENAIETAEPDKITVSAPKYGTSIRVDVPKHAASDLLLECVSHESAVVAQDASSVVYTTQETSKIEQDFIVIVKNAKGALRPQLWARTQTQANPETGVLNNVLAVNINPHALATTKRSPKDLIFVLDRSGSMSGNVETLRDALHLYLSSLPAPNKAMPIYFNFVSFGSDFKFLWPTSRLLSEESFNEARAFIDTIDADMGGTEILEPIKAIHKSLGKASYHTASGERETRPIDCEVVLLTDGEVFNVDEVRIYVEKMVQSMKGHARVHSFGIGDYVSHDLLDALASAGRGLKQTVVNGERMETKVSKVLQNVLASPVVKARVYWRREEGKSSDDDFEVVSGYSAPLEFGQTEESDPLNADAAQIVAPLSGLMPVYPNKDSLLYVFVKDGDVVSPSVKVELELASGETVSYETPVVEDVAIEQKDDDSEERRVERSEYLLLAAAKALLSSLQDEDARIDATVHTSIGEKTRILKKAEIIKLGELIGSTFGLVSPWTSLIAIEETAAGQDTETNVYVPNTNGEETIRMNGLMDAILCRSEDLSASSRMFYKSSRARSTPLSAGGIFSSIKKSLGSLGSLASPKPVAAMSPARPMVASAVPVPACAPMPAPMPVLAKSKPAAAAPQFDVSSSEPDACKRLADEDAESPADAAYSALAVVSRRCRFDGSFDVAADLVSLVEAPLLKGSGQSPAPQVLARISVARESSTPPIANAAYFALTVWAFLSTLEARSGLEKGALGDALRLLLDKVIGFVDGAYDEGETGKLEADREQLLAAYAVE